MTGQRSSRQARDRHPGTYCGLAAYSRQASFSALATRSSLSSLGSGGLHEARQRGRDDAWHVGDLLDRVPVPVPG